jgi:selT/selW/selH-like putative selenoprotein
MPAIASLRLLPSGGGRFEVTADDQLIYSKKAEGRHAAPGEIAQLLEKHLGITPMPPEG